MKNYSSKKIDMTTGPILKQVIFFAIPIVIGSILQQLYTTVDTLVIGQFCDKTDLAAVGTSAQPVEVLLCIFLGVGSGVSILVSQSAGSKNTENIIEFLKAATAFVYIAGIPLTVIGILCAPFILKFMGVPADTWNSALIYTRIVLAGTIGNIGYNLNAGVLRGLGDSKASLLFLIVSCISNIIMDYIFVAGIGMGVAGAALSTTIAMIISWAVSIVYITKRFPELQYKFWPHKFSGWAMKKILAMGLPIGFNSSLYSFGHMALQTLVNAQGSTFMAGISVAGRITGCANIAITALSQAASTFSGQNYGAKKFKRLKSGHILIPVMSGLITITFGTIFYLVRTPLLSFFTKESDVLVYADRYVSIMLFSQWLFAIFNGIVNIANGTGKVKYTMIVNLLMLWAVRVPCAIIIDKYYDGTYVMLCYPISFFFGMCCMIGYYIFSPSWKNIMQQAKLETEEI